MQKIIKEVNTKNFRRNYAAGGKTFTLAENVVIADTVLMMTVSEL
jgi:hypothetical protein